MPSPSLSSAPHLSLPPSDIIVSSPICFRPQLSWWMRDSWHGVVSSTFFLSFSFSSSFSFLPPFLLRQLVTHQTTAALALSTRPSRSLPPAPCLSSVIWSAVFYWPVFCCAAGQSGGLVRGNWWMAHPELYKASSSPLHWCVDAAQLAAQWVRTVYCCGFASRQMHMGAQHWKGHSIFFIVPLPVTASLVVFLFSFALPLPLSATVAV